MYPSMDCNAHHRSTTHGYLYYAAAQWSSVVYRSECLAYLRVVSTLAPPFFNPVNKKDWKVSRALPSEDPVASNYLIKPSTEAAIVQYIQYLVWASHCLPTHSPWYQLLQTAIYHNGDNDEMTEVAWHHNPSSMLQLSISSAHQHCEPSSTTDSWRTILLSTRDECSNHQGTRFIASQRLKHSYIHTHSNTHTCIHPSTHPPCLISPSIPQA